MDTFKKRVCRRCRAEFTPKRDWQDFCGTNCRVNFYQKRLDPDDRESVASFFMAVETLKPDHPFLKLLRSWVSRKVGAISNDRRHQEAMARKRKRQ